MSIFELSEQEIIDHISNFNIIRTKEKDKYGEVFTSIKLIDELLDNLPKSVWKKSELKWLDPAAGIGNFHALVYIRLLKGLEKTIPNMQKRKHHIIDNMLYMVELNSNNFQEIQNLFGKKANVSLASFFDQKEKWMKDLDQPTYDVIVGNPPFQTSKTTNYEGSAGNRTLWDKFLETIFKQQVLNTKGYLAFITPSNWRRPEHPLYKLLTRDNTLEYLHIYGKKEVLSSFGVQTRFDLYIIQEGQSKTDNKTRIIDEKGIKQSIKIHSWPFLPNFAFSKIKSIMVPEEKGIPIIFSAGLYDARKLSKTITTKKKHPIVHSITQKGLGIRYAAERNLNQFDIPKVLLNLNERQYPYNDYKGEYGMSQLTFGIPIKSKKEGDQWISVINSPLFEEIIRATKWGAFQTDYHMFKYFDPQLYNRSSFRKTRKNRT
jgi:hypothetical protein